MAKKVFLKKECKDVYVYIGHCPSCGREQNDMSERGADAICSECVPILIEERIMREAISPNTLAGAIVVSCNHDRYDFIEIELVDRNMEIYNIHAMNPAVYNGSVLDFCNDVIRKRDKSPTTTHERNWTVEIWKKLRSGNKP